MTCPHCQNPARFVNYRPKTFTGLTGDITLDRAYYHCANCHQGVVPWDETLGLELSSEKLTPAAQEVVTLLGLQNSFGKTADRILHKSTGLNLCESTVERTTEEAGERLGQWLVEGESFGSQEPWKWQVDAEGKTCAYVSLDMTGIQMQGPNGTKVDGRMIDVAMIYNPKRMESEKDSPVSMPCVNARYLAGHYQLAELGIQMRRQGAQVGMDNAERWIALSDAGNGFERWLDVNFPRAVRIVDFRHASGYVNDFATVYRVGEEGKALATQWCHHLKHEGGASFLRILEGLDRESMSEAARVQHDKILTYFRNHHTRMDYPTYRSKGWQIGTGAMESACKNVINQRLSMGGMRWGEEGSDGVSHLRALFCSDADQWDGFWSHRPKATWTKQKKSKAKRLEQIAV